MGRPRTKSEHMELTSIADSEDAADTLDEMHKAVKSAGAYVGKKYL